jgi:hypothetical protein
MIAFIQQDFNLPEAHKERLGVHEEQPVEALPCGQG